MISGILMQGGDKVVKVKTLKRFRDMEVAKYRDEGDVFSTSEDRGRKLIGLGLAEEVKEQKKAKEAAK